MRGRRHTIRTITACFLALLAGACAHLPTDQAAAFKTIASGSEKGFAALSGAQAGALANEQLARAANGKTSFDVTASCFNPDVATDPCFVVVGGIELGSHSERLQKLLGAVSVYASGMSDLAVAKDLDDAADATGKVKESLKSLLGSLPAPEAQGARAAVELLAFGSAQLRIEERRRTMARIAAAANPVIVGTAGVLGEETTQMRGILLDIRKTRLRHALQDLDTFNAKPPADSDEASTGRTKLMGAVSTAAAAVNQARGISTDFTPLIRSHQALLASLRNPHADITASVTEAEAFQASLQSLTRLGSSSDQTDSESKDQGGGDDSQK
jgi:hypothetical protein